MTNRTDYFTQPPNGITVTLPDGTVQEYNSPEPETAELPEEEEEE